MVLPVINGVARAAVNGLTQTGRKWVNVHHFQYAAGASSPGTIELDNLDVELFKFYAGPIYTGGVAITANMPAATSLQSIDYTVLDGVSLAYSKSHIQAGGGGTNSLPAEVSMCITLRTTKRGRRNRGRLYLPPFTPTLIDATGNWQATQRTQIIAQYNGMLSALAAKQWVPVVASYGESWINDPDDPHDKIKSTWTPYATPINSVTIDTKPDVQRRRK